MPLIQVDLNRSLYLEKRELISAAIHQAQLETLDITPDDLFQIFNPHGPDELIFSPTFGQVKRKDLIVIRITKVHKHSVAVKKNLYREILERLEAIGIRRDDVQLVVIENGFEDWFAGVL